MSRSPKIANMMTVVVSLLFTAVCLVMAFWVDNAVAATILAALAVAAALNAMWAARRGPR